MNFCPQWRTQGESLQKTAIASLYATIRSCASWTFSLKDWLGSQEQQASEWRVYTSYSTMLLIQGTGRLWCGLRRRSGRSPLFSLSHLILNPLPCICSVSRIHTLKRVAIAMSNTECNCDAISRHLPLLSLSLLCPNSDLHALIPIASFTKCSRQDTGRMFMQGLQKQNTSWISASGWYTATSSVRPRILENSRHMPERSNLYALSRQGQRKWVIAIAERHIRGMMTRGALLCMQTSSCNSGLHAHKTAAEFAQAQKCKSAERYIPCSDLCSLATVAQPARSRNSSRVHTSASKHFSSVSNHLCQAGGPRKRYT